MKKSLTIIGTALILATATTSCHDDEYLLDGQGKLMISATLNSDVKVRSRATIEELSESCKIYISNAKGPVRKYVGISNVPADGIDLLSGAYTAEAWAGDSVPASFDDRYFKGAEPFEITNGQTTHVNLTCKIANAVASVNYAANIDEMLSDYTMTVGHAGGTLTFEGRDTRKGYFMMTSKSTDLEYTLSGKLPSGETYTRTGKIENAKPATEYVLNVKYSGSDAEIGGGYFTIEIDERAVEVNDEIVIALSPQIEGFNFDIDKPLVAEQGKVGRHAVVIYGSTQLTGAVLTSDVLGTKTSIGGNDVNLFTMSDAIKTELENAGINTIYSYNSEDETSWLKINFEETLLNTLEEGTYTFNIHATDANNKTSDATLTLTISNAPVAVDDVVSTDVWASKATITGSILKADVQSPVLRYRVKGQSAWIDATTTVEGTKLSAEITGLTPGTVYEYCAAATDYTPVEYKTFTTEAATQLPNASFEDWSSSGSVRLLYGAGQSMFWDSGNHGSSTMNKNVTDSSTEKVHSGNYSVKLSSQFVGVGAFGKFAAGNLFVGEYLATVGTNGVLGWGRSWTSRPTALKGYVHYTPVAITSASSDLPNVNKGDMDNGIIYIAILDSSTKSYEGKNYPVIVNTKTKQFFSKDDANVIAYGELVLTEATAGDAMVEFTIPLTYTKTNVKAANIAIVGSASRYGDYFTGGNGSVMYLDDLQLVY